MRKHIKTALLSVFLLSLFLPVFAGSLESCSLQRGFDFPQSPRLRYPITEEVVLTGKDSLEFKWWNDVLGIDHYEFKLFKGYNMHASDLISKQILPAGSSSIEIKSDLFEDGQIYTWSLIQVGLGGRKSDKSFNSFKVIKK